MNTLSQLLPLFDHHTTKTIAYRAFSRADAYPLFDAAKNPEFNKKLWWGPPQDINDVVIEVEKLLLEHHTNNAVVLSVVERDTSKWIGMIKFAKWEDSLIMTLWTHPDYWRSMTAFRCAEAAVEIVMRNTDITCMYCRVSKDYPIMEKLVTNSGFHHIEESFGVHTKGHTVPCNVYKLDRIDWLRQPKIQAF